MLHKSLIFCIALISHFGGSICNVDFSDEKFSSHLMNEYTSYNGKKVFIFDGIIPEELIIGLQKSLVVDDNWRFVLHDDFITDGGRQYDSKNGVPWKNWLDPNSYSTTKVGMAMKELVEAVDARVHNDTVDFEMNEIYTGLIRRGDRTTLHRENEDSAREYSIVMYHNVVWRKNAYGETFFYDDEEEIFAAVRAKFGRVVVWDSSIPYIFRPPSITQLKNQVIHVATFSSNVTKTANKREYFRKFLGQLQMPANQDFVCTDSARVDELDLEKHLTMKRQNRNGFQVAVFDGLFSDTDLLQLRTWVIDKGLFFFADLFDMHSDNVHFIAGISVENFMKSRFWPVVQQLAKYISGKDTWYPYDVACNLIRSTDHTRIHRDTSGESGYEEELTFLLYLSPNWTAGDYGETVFMEYDYDSPENEYVAEVLPFLGRAVIFDGDFPHSARPPSVTHYGPRYTFAVKLAIDQTVASQKMLDDESRHEMHWHSVTGTLQSLERFPEASIASHKVEAVSTYLQMKQVQMELDKTIPQEEESDEDEESDKAESDEAEIPEESLSEDGQESLSPSKLRMLHNMQEHHRIHELMNESVSEETDYLTNMPDSIFNMERRLGIINGWIKSASGDPEVLTDYVDLYLKQQAWIKKNIARNRMLTII